MTNLPKRPHRLSTISTLLAAAILVATCGGAASPSPTTVILTPDEAAARVIQVVPSLEGVAKPDPNVIGGCCFYTARSTGDGFEVVVEVGWGDCQAGCVNRHHWTFAVTGEGAVTLVGEDGAPVPDGLPGSGVGGSGGIPPGQTGIAGRALAGPTCPVEVVGDPSCDPRAVVGALVLVLDAGGAEIARLTTDAAGAFSVALPAGNYRLEPQPKEGFMRAPDAIAVTVGASPALVELAYDTGIR